VLHDTVGLFYVLLTVQPGTLQLWVNDQLDAQLRYKIRLLLLLLLLLLLH